MEIATPAELSTTGRLEVGDTAGNLRYFSELDAPLSPVLGSGFSARQSRYGYTPSGVMASRCELSRCVPFVGTWKRSAPGGQFTAGAGTLALLLNPLSLSLLCLGLPGLLCPELALAADRPRTLSDAAPYPSSPMITSLKWDKSVVKLKTRAGDNWPITWVDRDLQITAWGDGPGFDEQPPRLSLGFAQIWGNPPNLRGQDFASDADTIEGGGSRAIKASGLLQVDGTLYMWVRNFRPTGSDDFTNARLAWSRNRGTNWTWADWHFADTFGCPEFIQFGPSYTGARDDYVYVVSQANDSAYGYSPDIVMARVPKDQVPERDRYEFFAGLRADGEPEWSKDLSRRKPIFTDPRGTQRIAITYNAGLKRYLLTTSHRPPGSQATHTAALGVFDAPEPWGPWTTVFYDSNWSGTNRTYHHKFPTKWMSPDGRTLWLLYSGLDGGLYTFCLKKATLEVSSRAGFEVPRMWEFSAPLIGPEPLNSNPSLAQKDPSVVFYGGKWHVFMTVKLPGKSAIEYCSFEKWDKADAAPRTILKVSDSNYYCAPQVFYFRPHQKWYLVYQMGVPGLKKMWVAYSTTTDIANPQSWTSARAILDGGKDDPRTVGGLDYWIICDEARAYLFLTSLDGKMWRLWTRREDFPGGFGHCELALQAKVFEASHTYKLKGMDKYLTLIEENGRRYYKAYLADRLDGEWVPLADTADRPFAGWNNIRPAAGVASWTDNVSHGELIRDGWDETLTVDPGHLRFVFQGMLDKHKSGKEYGQFQWRIGMLTPVPAGAALQ